MKLLRPFILFLFYDSLYSFSDDSLFESKKFRKPCFLKDEAENTWSGPIVSCQNYPENEIKLTRLNGVKTGHAQLLELEEGKTVKLITRAMSPLLFEIPNFLSDEECEHIVSLAKDSGLSTSTSGLFSYEGDLDRELATADSNWTLSQKDAFAAEFEVWDANRDGYIDATEIMSFAGTHKKLYLNQDEVCEMLKYLKISDPRNNGKLDPETFYDLNLKKLLSYMDFLKDKTPRHRYRFSQQAWLRQDKSSDPVLRRLHERIIKLTKLPRKIIQGGEPMQVVRYEKYGHYHGHLDSTTKDPSVPCCHQNILREPDCRVCRFITILFYLNNVEQGGETAFLIADNTTTLEEIERSKAAKDEFNLSVSCYSANLVLPPSKGTAIMWYNNFIDPDSGLLGPVDGHSVHGGCEVIKGEKWIANNWLTAPTKYSQHIKSEFDFGFD